MYLIYDGLFDNIRRNYFRKLLDVNNIKPGARVLDYGCGPGDMLQECRANGIEALGIDNSLRSVELAKKRGLDVILGDHTTLCKDVVGQFDMVLLQSVIEHVNNPLELLESIKGLLKPNAVIVISAPTPSVYFWDDPTHIRPHTPKSLHTFADMLEMECIYVSYVATFLLGIKLTGSWFYRILNVIPISLGSNLVAFYRLPSIN